MRSKFLACAALAALGLSAAAPAARAADPKSKKKSAELGDAVSKQLEWENQVMGPDDKRAELDKIARAQAISKAAAEKAEKDKAEKEKQAAREAAQQAKQPKKNEVALPTLPDEGAKAKVDKHEPAKLETADSTPPAPAAKPADDKFIDKLLKDEGGSKKRVSKTDDKALDELLAVSKDKPAAAKGKGKKGDMVDSLLESADKEPAMPAPKARPVVPEWAKPELPATPPPAPVIARPQPKKDDGVIHVVQGAASPAAAPVSRPMPVAARVTTPTPVGRKQTASASGNWNDPFADGGGSSKKVAARDRQVADRGAHDPFADGAPVAASSRRAAPAPIPAARTAPARSGGGSWNDPFADGPEPRKAAAKRTPAPAPAPKAKSEPARRSAGWKDPFTEAEPAPRATHTTVAMREPARGESGKWEIASARRAPKAHAAEGHGGWAVLKKRH